MTLGEFRKQTKNMSDDLELEIYTERFNDSTQPTKLDFTTEGYIEFIINDDRWGLVEQKKIDKAIDEVYKIRKDVLYANGCYEPNDVLDIIDQITKLFEEI
jgi:hypothetical protein